MFYNFYEIKLSHLKLCNIQIFLYEYKSIIESIE